MKIAIIGSSHYYDQMIEHKSLLELDGHEVELPTLDHHDVSNELDLMERNRAMIIWCDEVHLMWNQRSWGTWGDFCMAFALHKPVKRVFLETKTMGEVVRLYSEPY